MSEAKLKNLSPRLKTVAAMVRQCECVADIGTDHAYLPIYLVRHGVCKRAIASDLRKGPLENAKNGVDTAGLAEKIELRLSDGLKNYTPNEVSDVVIAGMGGILIAEILENAPWLKSFDKHLVLQPMTHAEYLRAFLASNGYEIMREGVCEDTGKLYCVMSVIFTGREQALPEHYEYYGELPKCQDPLAAVYLGRLAERYSREADSTRCSDPKRAAKLYSISEKLDSIVNG